jgi:L,D-peptidoglycan transpeptidase YkuD (ErfK/YbiS/YcfS/YnhG family)
VGTLGGVSLKTAVGRWGFTKDSREGRGVWGNNAWRLH